MPRVVWPAYMCACLLSKHLVLVVAHMPCLLADNAQVACVIQLKGMRLLHCSLLQTATRCAGACCVVCGHCGIAVHQCFHAAAKCNGCGSTPPCCAVFTDLAEVPGRRCAEMMHHCPRSWQQLPTYIHFSCHTPRLLCVSKCMSRLIVQGATSGCAAFVVARLFSSGMLSVFHLVSD